MGAFRDAIRDAVDQAGGEPDLDEVTKHVVNQLTDEDIADALFKMVRQQVLIYLHDQRTTTFVDTPEPNTASPRPGRSRIGRAVAARDRWLNIVVCIDESEGRHKRLASCSLADVRQVVANREARARSTQAEANRFKKLAEVMAAEGAATPANISPAALEALILGWRS